MPAPVETSQAGGEVPNLWIRMSLTIAPDGRPAFRADANTRINIMDVDPGTPGQRPVGHPGGTVGRPVADCMICNIVAGEPQLVRGRRASGPLMM